MKRIKRKGSSRLAGLAASWASQKVSKIKTEAHFLASHGQAMVAGLSTCDRKLDCCLSWEIGPITIDAIFKGSISFIWVHWVSNKGG